jgi:hypothetical protein
MISTIKYTNLWSRSLRIGTNVVIHHRFKLLTAKDKFYQLMKATMQTNCKKGKKIIIESRIWSSSQIWIVKSHSKSLFKTILMTIATKNKEINIKIKIKRPINKWSQENKKQSMQLINKQTEFKSKKRWII